MEHHEHMEARYVRFDRHVYGLLAICRRHPILFARIAFAPAPLTANPGAAA
jgi:hypothetical protein